MSPTLCIIQREGENGSNIKTLLKVLQSQTLASQQQHSQQQQVLQQQD